MSLNNDFGAALAAMQAGKAVRRSCWGDGQSYSLTQGPEPKLVLAIPPDGEAAGVTQDGSPRGRVTQLSLDTVLATDWEIPD